MKFDILSLLPEKSKTEQELIDMMITKSVRFVDYSAKVFI